MKIVVSLGLMLSLMTTAAFSVPSQSGPTGEFESPTAEVASKGQISVGYNLLKAGQWDATAGIRMVYGLAPNIEIGVGQVDQMQLQEFVEGPDLITDENNWSVNIKYRTPYAPGGFALAVGAINSRYSSRSEDSYDGSTASMNNLYLVGTKKFDKSTNGSQMGLNLGLNWTVEKLKYFGPDEDWEFDENTSKCCPFVGAQVTFPKGTCAIFELRETAIHPMVSLALRIPISNALNTEIAFSRMSSGDEFPSNDLFIAGFNYTFDTGR